MRMPITDLQLQGRSLNKGPACWTQESSILCQLRLYGPQAAAPDQWLNAKDTQAKPFFGDRRSSNGQFWLEHSPTPLNFPWTAGHSRISAVQSGSDWLCGQVKWWWTGRPGVLRFMGSQRVGHDWATELNWTELKGSSSQPLPIFPYIEHLHEDLPAPGTVPTSLASPALADRFFTTEPPEFLTWAKATPVRTKIPASLRPIKFMTPLPACKPVSTWELIRISILPVNMSKKKDEEGKKEKKKKKSTVRSVFSCTISPSQSQIMYTKAGIFEDSWKY